MFSPFQAMFEELTAADLERLRGTTEGWYVEYKREIPQASSIAKSISALANTYGGWLFFGIEELAKDNAVACAFPGVPCADADAALQRIRQAVADHMNPAAHFDARAIEGAEGASFESDRVVIAIRVPQSLSAPHVHRSGQIYRRVADGSEPRPENDRYLLDQLFRRGDELRREFSEWVDRDPEFSKSEENVPFLRLMMICDPWREEDPWLEIEADELWKIFNASPGVVSSVPFETLYTSARGFVARQCNTNDPHNLGLTWQFQQSLVSDLTIPLNFYEMDRAKFLYEPLEGYVHGKRFIDLLNARNYSSPKIVDLNMLFNLLVGVVEAQYRILKRAGWRKPYFAKARLLNAWRTVPFVDVDVVLDRFEAFGLPVCLHDVSTTPPGTDPDSFVRVRSVDPDVGDEVNILLQALDIFRPIAQAWGLPPHVELGEERPYYMRLQEAGLRAMEVQARRARR